MLRVGVDVGSTTVKVVALAGDGSVVFRRYGRHNTQSSSTVAAFLGELRAECGEDAVRLMLTGSVGMGLAERHCLPFTQEVVAATHALQAHYPFATTMIDIGGEDAKVVFFKDGKATDLRMNGNCAGGTGAFIDQMAVLLNVSVSSLNTLALSATRTYPIASRCGVFSKTDIQNLLANNVSREDIAASIFHAVAVQTVVTLAKGYTITAPLLFCGGPLTFLPALRKAFASYLSLGDDDIILPADGATLPAWGAALSISEEETPCSLSTVIAALLSSSAPVSSSSAIAPLFSSADEYTTWQQRLAASTLPQGTFTEGDNAVFLGIDAGSTTTKIIVLNEKKEILFTYYAANGGSALSTVAAGLTVLQERCRAAHATLTIVGSCSTGYGEDLIRAAFSLHGGIVETIAHYLAAQHFDNEVSFVLDIGGQDMKAIFVDDGVIDRIEINEACSSGCGSFLETFAKTLGYTAGEFAQMGCCAAAPCDLGTRCTVFMNSKVKQALREGATTGDIAAGLAVSVVKNCLYKVLKLKDINALGQHIVVQGGTMRNDGVVRALEQLTGAEVRRSDMPEMMGAFGSALYAMSHAGGPVLSLDALVQQAQYSSKVLHCRGCHNQCAVTRYRFDNGGTYYAGNKCEKVFTNGGGDGKYRGVNTYLYKYSLLFAAAALPPSAPRGTVGIPRVLNMYEEYPFWQTLFTHCGFQVVLSSPSALPRYEACARMVMSDNICFPAKLVHSHISDLVDRGVDRIFLPFVVHEAATDDQNSYNCPVVTGYSAVVHATQPTPVPLDTPTISFKDKHLLQRQCEEYFGTLGIDKKTVHAGLKKAQQAMDDYAAALVAENKRVRTAAHDERRMVILLAGRPYHTDPLIQHDVAEMIADLGIDVLTDDIIRGADDAQNDTNLVAQWAYPNRILHAAQWAARQGADVQFVQMTSFGCGPDAFLCDEVRDLLLRYGKPYTLLKLDDITNVGSMKLRVRSLIESLKLRTNGAATTATTPAPAATTAIFTDKDRRRTVLAPFFTPFISPLIPAALRRAGYNVVNLPLSDKASVEWGLRYANNEVCYPATLIVGDVIKAFTSGQYAPGDCAVAITQTGGQCRASNYVALIKKALADAGYAEVPVVTVALGEDLGNEQPGWKVNWAKLMPMALRAMLFTDAIAKFYYATLVREKTPGAAEALKDQYLATAEELIVHHRENEFFDYLDAAAAAFDAVCEEKECHKVGVVGEIFVKFNAFSHKNVVDWLIERGVEVLPPLLMDFFLQAFVNRKVNAASHVAPRHWSDALYSLVYGRIRRQIAHANSICQRFRYFTPFGDIFHEAAQARRVITLNAQFGEGWLLPGEIMSFAANGVRNVISLQPFGCIANHIISRGIERRIKQYYPDINLLSLDFDSGVSDVNVTNRMLLFLDNLL